MAWSYSGDPSNSAKDTVRFLIGDTDNRDPLLQDAEITYFLSQHNNAPVNAAIRCCETIMAKFARLCDESVGQVHLSLSQKYKSFREMRDQLQQRLATGDATPYAGGISVSDKETQTQNKDRVEPTFRKHMMEDYLIAPWTTQAINEFNIQGDL